MTFKVNSAAANVVIGVAMLPAIGLLAVAFGMFEQGRSGIGAAAAGGFLAILMGAGLAARKLSRDIEVTETGIREAKRGVEIRWDEPHELVSETRLAKRTGVTITGSTRFSIRAPDGRRIAFNAIAPAGMVGLAAKMPAANELRHGSDGIARATALSTAALLAAARARLARGEAVAFGPVAVTPAGVELGGEVVPRRMVRLAREADLGGRGRVALHIEGGKTHRHPLTEVPNLAVLESLLADPPS